MALVVFDGLVARLFLPPAQSAPICPAPEPPRLARGFFMGARRFAANVLGSPNRRLGD
jgi:hypothetical protein